MLHAIRPFHFNSYFRCDDKHLNILPIVTLITLTEGVFLNGGGNAGSMMSVGLP